MLSWKYSSEFFHRHLLDDELKKRFETPLLPIDPKLVPEGHRYWIVRVCFEFFVQFRCLLTTPFFHAEDSANILL